MEEMKGIKQFEVPGSVLPKPYATEGRAAFMIRSCIQHFNKRGRIVAKITLGRFLYQNLLDNISIAYEAKGEDVEYNEVEYAGTLITYSMALNSKSGFEWELSPMGIN